MSGKAFHLARGVLGVEEGRGEVDKGGDVVWWA